jgi:hypothetical protein
MKRMSDKHLSKKSLRSVKANAVRKTTADDEEKEAFKTIKRENTNAEIGSFMSYRTMIGRNRILFAPHEESHVSYHKTNIFCFRHGLRVIPQVQH